MAPVTNLPELYVQTVGAGSPIVLIHGGGSSHRYWQKLVPLLSSSHQVITPDLLGWGESPKPKKNNYSADEQAEAINQTLNRLQISGAYRLLGHSIGAIVAVRMAQLYPRRVERLVLSAPEFFTGPLEAKRLFGKAVAVPNLVLFGPIAWLSCQVFCRTRVIPRLIARLSFNFLPREATDDVTSHTWSSFKGTRDNLILQQHALAELASLTIPVDVVIGEQDPSMEPAAVEQLRQMPHVNLYFLPSGHNLPYSQTELLAQLIGSDLSQKAK